MSDFEIDEAQYSLLLKLLSLAIVYNDREFINTICLITNLDM